MVQWRSQGGPVQFLMFGGLVIGSHGLVSSEHRTSRVTWTLRPHLAVHWAGGRKCFMGFIFRSGNVETWVVPRSTLPPPTGGHRRGSCKAASLSASPGRPWCRARCRLSCPGPATASSNSEPGETGTPPRRFLSTRSSCSPPT